MVVLKMLFFKWALSIVEFFARAECCAEKRGSVKRFFEQSGFDEFKEHCVTAFFTGVLPREHFVPQEELKGASG